MSGEVNLEVLLNNMRPTPSPPFTPVFPLKTQNLAQTWPEHPTNKKGLRF